MNIIILSYRVSGNDGVSLECAHWKEILERMGHRVTFLAGQLDRSGVVMPELHFQNPSVSKIHDRVTYGRGKYKSIESQIYDIAGTIEGKLRHFFNTNKGIDLIIAPNVFSLPMHFPLSVALKRVVEDLNIPVIARHHDFWWERKRYLKSSLFPFFEKFFPPNIYLIKHTVINSISRDELRRRTGIEAEVISDSFNFANIKLPVVDGYSKHFRRDFEIGERDVVFMQTTRIVPRKRLEVAISFFKRLALKNAVLVISGHSGDEGLSYLQKIQKLCETTGINYRIIGEYVDSKRRIYGQLGASNKRRVYSLWDCYRNADFILYPTEAEGFGNQFIEAVYFKKPIILTPYPVFTKDIVPLGFETINIENRSYNKDAINFVRRLLKHPNEIELMVEKNFAIGAQNFSYEATSEKIRKLLNLSVSRG